VQSVLGHYRILEKLGAGGMGEVYLAEDTKLGRKIALKVLPPELASSPERLVRFESEAKAVAALNHPNIVTVHSVEEADGIRFLSMEAVQGKTLSSAARGVPLGKFFDIAVALAVLNGSRIERATPLQDGDEIRLGSVDLTFRSPSKLRSTVSFGGD
jgi:serine/threonine-protein kinase